MMDDYFGTDMIDPAVKAELLRPRGRGRPASLEIRQWEASLRLQAGRPGGAANQQGLNREVFEAARRDIAAQRRGELHLHRSDRRDEARLARRALVEGLVAMRPGMSAQSLARWIKRSCPCTIAGTLTVRTLRDDISAIRKAGSATHAHKS